MKKEEKYNLTESDKITIITNHNYFIRTAISNVTDTIIATIIYALILLILKVITAALAVSTSQTTSQAISDLTSFSIISSTISFLLALALGIFAIVKIASISVLKRQIDKAEADAKMSSKK